MAAGTATGMFVSCATVGPEPATETRFAVVADIQYADKETQGTRFYRASIPKLGRIIPDIVARDPAFTVQLGDLIDGHPNDLPRSIQDLETILAACRGLPEPVVHVVGNHCMAAGADALHHHLALPRFYYAFTRPELPKWRVLVLDGNDAGYGVFSEEQTAWIEEQLTQAANHGDRVLCLCHFPLIPEAGHHRIAKPNAVLAAMDRTGCVAAWLAGHDHAGGYALRNGVHHITFKGIVEQPDALTYAIVTLTHDTITIDGLGRETDRTLTLRCPAQEDESPGARVSPEHVQGRPTP